MAWKLSADQEEELREVAASNGGLLLPDHVVRYARNPKRALHSRFQWDDSKAAVAYRLWQARCLIEVAIEIIDDGTQKRQIPRYVSLLKDRNDGNGYRSVTSVLRNKQLRAQLLAEAFDEAERYKTKYNELSELSEIFDAIDKVKSKDRQAAPGVARQGSVRHSRPDAARSRKTRQGKPSLQPA